MSNKLKMKSNKNKKQSREAEVKANTTPWLIGLIAFAVVIIGLAIASSFVWGTQSFGKKSAASTEAVTSVEVAPEATTEAPAEAQ